MTGFGGAPASGIGDLNDLLPWRIDIVPFTNTIFVQGSKALAALASGVTGGVYNGSNVQNDEYGWDVVLAAGTWTIEALIQKQATAAIASVRLDGTEVGTWDTYAAATTPNSLFTVSGIAIPAAAKKRLTLKAATRNAAATGWVVVSQTITLRRTA